MKKLVYIIEGAGWSTDWDGQSIVANLKDLNGKVDVSPLGHTDGIIHFGSLPVFVASDKHHRLLIDQIDPHNPIVLTIFHIDEKYRKGMIMTVLDRLSRINVFHTSCQITKKELVGLGIPSEKIAVIPLGVDTSVFSPASLEKKSILRKELGIAENKVVIGSFQKDGNGWGEGETPKLIKGPDIFCQVLESLSLKFPVMALLTGPARGYVKNRLKHSGIPYLHYYPQNYEEVAEYFHALDFYLISSRIEGGPKAILESWASGIPLVSTAVGMVPDIALHEKNALLVESENVNGLIGQSERLIFNPNLREKLAANGLAEVQNYSWTIIADQYYQHLYAKLQ